MELVRRAAYRANAAKIRISVIHEINDGVSVRLVGHGADEIHQTISIPGPQVRRSIS